MIISTIAIVDDHKLLRETWAEMINGHLGYQVTGIFGSAEEGLEKIKSILPDVLLLDINLPGISGLEAVKEFRYIAPQLKIIGVSLYNQPEFAKKMIRSGAMGYVTKSSSLQELMKAINEVVQGRKFICEEIKQLIFTASMSSSAERPRTLSNREVQVASLLKTGLTSKGIASELDLSVKTVEVHRYNILKKLRIKNTASLIDYLNNHPDQY